MKTLRARNVNDLLIQGLELLGKEGIASPSRAGDVVVVPYPVMSVYEQPCERVLFDAKRDANPFFHLMEGLWMLAGRNDAAFLNNYITDFGERFAESATGKQNWEAGGEIHDAYGYRWRKAMGFDQLDMIVERLKRDPLDRQAVLQMWDGADHSDIWSGGSEGERLSSMDDLNGSWKTRPCNTHAYFRVLREPFLDRMVLDMTILCRSNDVVWGAYGANAVHFSMLQEYVAGRVGVTVGTMYQLSNNYHGYVNVLDKFDDPAQMTDSDHYDSAIVFSESMGTDWSEWDKDLKEFMDWHEGMAANPMGEADNGLTGHYTNQWFAETAQNVAVTRLLWKIKERERAVEVASLIEARDWRMACQQWMQRRMER